MKMLTLTFKGHEADWQSPHTQNVKNNRSSVGMLGQNAFFSKLKVSEIKQSIDF